MFASRLRRYGHSVTSVGPAAVRVAEWSAFGRAWRYSRGEALVMFAVAALRLLQNTQWALGVGVLVSIALLAP